MLAVMWIQWSVVCRHVNDKDNSYKNAEIFLNKQINAISTLLTHMSVRHTPVLCRNG